MIDAVKRIAGIGGFAVAARKNLKHAKHMSEQTSAFKRRKSPLQDVVLKTNLESNLVERLAKERASFIAKSTDAYYRTLANEADFVTHASPHIKQWRDDIKTDGGGGSDANE